MMKTLVVTIGSLLINVGLAHAGDFVKGEMLVKYKKGALRDRVAMNAFYQQNGVVSVFRFGGIMVGYEKLKFSEEKSLNEALTLVLQDPLVESAQPNYIFRAQPVNMPKKATTAAPCTGLFGCSVGQLGEGWPGNPGGGKPNRPDVLPAPAEVIPPVEDPRIGELYGLKNIGVTEALEESRNLKKVVIADIDTGIDYNHEDLAPMVWRNGTGVHGDIVGYNFVSDDELPFDDADHGSHTAGTIGASRGNGKGVAGVATNVSIMTLKFLSGNGGGTTANAIRAIDYAIQNGARILSNSWGARGLDDAALKESIVRAKDKDVLFVAAAGNDSYNNDSGKAAYPASFDVDNIISVAAVDRADNIASFSNYGKNTVHLAAPGVKTLSTVPGGKYAEMSGTSMACPHVAGAAALVLGKHPEYTYKQVKEALLKSVDLIPGLTEKTITGGRLNVAKAMKF
jgi:subtilisin family serine protease